MPPEGSRRRHPAGDRSQVAGRFFMRRVPGSGMEGESRMTADAPGDAVEPRALLLTGRPGIGKTTVVRRVADRLAGHAIGGFLTEEIRAEGRRVGFRLRTFGEGDETILAHLDFRSAHRVGRYGVNVKGIDAIVENALRPGPGVEIFLVDEIGKMECLSARFVAAMERLLASECQVVATISDHGGGFIARAKARPDVRIWRVERQNRGDMPERIVEWLGVTSRRGSPRAD
jgi:nucleoside-triphosphatase